MLGPVIALLALSSLQPLGGASPAQLCPCMREQLCPVEPFGNHQLDIRYFGPLEKCAQSGERRCCNRERFREFYEAFSQGDWQDLPPRRVLRPIHELKAELACLPASQCQIQYGRGALDVLEYGYLAPCEGSQDEVRCVLPFPEDKLTLRDQLLGSLASAGIFPEAGNVRLEGKDTLVIQPGSPVIVQSRDEDTAEQRIVFTAKDLEELEEKLNGQGLQLPGANVPRLVSRIPSTSLATKISLNTRNKAQLKTALMQHLLSDGVSQEDASEILKYLF